MMELKTFTHGGITKSLDGRALVGLLLPLLSPLFSPLN